MASAPISYGVLLFPQFEVLDVAGPIEALNALCLYMGQEIKLSVIAPTLDPVDPGDTDPASISRQFNGQQKYLPTHTFETAPELDVIIIPGGLGVFKLGDTLNPTLDFLRTAYHGSNGRRPLQYIFSVCTGAALLAQSGILDGQRATTNKRAWSRVTPMGPKTYWVAQARWVVSGNVWTTSGVEAGLDGMIGFLTAVYDDATAQNVCNIIEYVRQKDPDCDPFAALNGCHDVPPTA